MREILTAILLITSLAAPAAAQDVVGFIEGVVTDASGAVLPGVTVTITSPALIGGPKTSVSDTEGRYRFPLLPPGEYELKAELSGFATIRRPSLPLRAGQTMTIDVEMRVGGVAETVEVRAEAPVIDLRSTVRDFNIDAKAIQKIPLTTGQRYADLFVLAPGVQDTLDTSQTGTNFSVNGASATQQKVFIDGIDMRDHVNASLTSNISNSIIQEVSIATTGFQADSGFSTGGFMNIVTRSGGNQFHGGAAVYLTPKRFNDTNVPGVAPANVETYFPEGNLGGPIKRDRLWFFTSEKYLIQNSGFFNVPDFDKELRSHEFYTKVTHQVATQHRLAYIYQHDKRDSKNDFATAIFAEDATSIARFGGYMAGVNWDYQMGGNRFLRVVGSYFDKPNATDGRNGTQPRRIYQSANGTVLRFENNYDRDQRNEQTRWYFSGNYAQSLNAAGLHDLTVSTEYYPRTSRLLKLRLNVLETYRDSPIYGPRQLYSIQTPRPLEGTENDGIDKGYSFGIQDSWRPTSRLTVNAGLRYEWYKTTIEGVEQTFTDFSAWSPRVGAAYAINDKTVVKSSYSRLGQVYALDFLFSFYPNQVVMDTATSSQVNGVLDIFTQGSSTATTTRNVDRGVPYAHEFVMSVQRHLPWGIAADVSFLRRRFTGFTDNVDRNLILDIPNRRFVGRVDPRFDQLLDVVTNDRSETVYNSLQVWANRRFADRWQLDASYTYQINRRDGEFGYGTAANAALQFAYGDRASDFFEEVTGTRHLLKLAGSYTFPWDVTLGVYYSKKGRTFAYDVYSPAGMGATAPRVTLSNGRIVADPLFNPTLLVAPPSEEVGRRIGGAHLLNLQVEKIFRVGGQSFRLMALAYNLPNNARRGGFLSNNIAATNYNSLSSAQAPRAAQIAFGWEF